MLFRDNETRVSGRYEALSCMIPNGFRAARNSGPSLYSFHWIKSNKLIFLCDFQAKIQKHQAFEAEVAAHSNAIVVLDNTGSEMISAGHFASETIRRRLDELHRLWELLLSRLAEKGMKLQQALVLVQFLRHCDEVMFWIHDKVKLASDVHQSLRFAVLNG